MIERIRQGGLLGLFPYSNIVLTKNWNNFNFIWRTDQAILRWDTSGFLLVCVLVEEGGEHIPAIIVSDICDSQQERGLTVSFIIKASNVCHSVYKLFPVFPGESSLLIDSIRRYDNGL